ncbi:hypothetical protein [Corallococcus carmarthensis]|uniref:Uncharacterized protein n=1 Tax=Corallococcus carmarthensis TaxID=2316728 RepID=A0A3A8KHI1_9BACT|nr:hypothetical protein [Corallococcus carmarthensis]RKH03661.1 hypothetical protein D7X32_13470 [Corallococcus carmarthensis]
MSKATATVKVRLVVEVKVNSAWGDNCTVGQVQEQGTREAIATVTRLLTDSAASVVQVDACVMTLSREPAR